VKDRLAALMPPHQRHAGTVGACGEAVVLTLRTGEPAVSRGAERWAGDDVAVRCQRPVDAAQVPDHRWGRAWDPLGATGLDRRYGGVSSPALHR
jgi:hypothetical protein